MNKSWDIFCNVIDNYGDAGVCWRLARQLAVEYGLAVRLWIDDLQTLQKLQPDVASQSDTQHIAGVDIHHWTEPLVFDRAAAVVIEAFACHLPLNYLRAMSLRTPPSLWINLEYLSAEEWVSSCHSLPSPQTNFALRKFFFFPGFTEGTGGVPGERDLMKGRRAFQADAAQCRNFLRRIGVSVPADARLISLFSYAEAPIAALLHSWESGVKPIVCLVPEGQPLPAIARFFGEQHLSIGAIKRSGSLTVQVLPFLSQRDYDYLLWSCDINFVRGEDSFVRAQWAGRPFIWQIYPQSEQAHWPKLEAFLQLYKTVLPEADTATLIDLWRAWNGAGDIGAAWRKCGQIWPAAQLAAETWSDRLDAGTNLAAALVQFCANRV
jgi:uncharacterized repeat protein (TIGR03837 family)